MITGKIYANGYWDGLDAILVRNDENNEGWVYVLGLHIPDPDMSMEHAIPGKTSYFHARVVTATPDNSELASLGAFVYVPN